MLTDRLQTKGHDAWVSVLGLEPQMSLRDYLKIGTKIQNQKGVLWEYSPHCDLQFTTNGGLSLWFQYSASKKHGKPKEGRCSWREESFYYEQQIKRELKGIHICGCRCNERLKAKTDGSKCLTYTGLWGDLEHLKIETMLIRREFLSVLSVDKKGSTLRD